MVHLSLMTQMDAAWRNLPGLNSRWRGRRARKGPEPALVLDDGSILGRPAAGAPVPFAAPARDLPSNSIPGFEVAVLAVAGQVRAEAEALLALGTAGEHAAALRRLGADEASADGASSEALR